MRKGFALVEMLVMIAVVAALSVVFAALTRPLIIEIPRANRVIEANSSVLNLLSQLRYDVETAVRLPYSFADKKTDPNNLLIELQNNDICYTVENGKVIRSILSGIKIGRAAKTWSIPKAKIMWRIWQDNGRPCAVEVSTRIEYLQDGHVKTKLGNSHVYFVGASDEAIKQK